MLKKKILLYSVLLIAIFFSLFFIVGQNQEYRKISRVEKQLYQSIQNELVAYHEGLYKIEQNKRALNSQGNSENGQLAIGTTMISVPPKVGGEQKKP